MKGHRNNPSFQFSVADIRDEGDVEEAIEGANAVFHEAAITSVSVSMEGSELT